MSYMNRACIMGNLGADPEIRKTQDGRPVANLRIATSESWKDKESGERKEKTEWHRVVCFSEGLCGVIEKYLNKGDKVYIEGQIKTRKWEDKDGVDRYSTEIVMQGFDAKLIMLGSPKGKRDDDGGDDRGGGDDDAEPPRRSARKPGRASAKDDIDDEIPF